MTLRERFWCKVDHEGRGTDECWEWTAAKDTGGYGVLGVGGKTHRAHRLAYELACGPIPDGLLLRHLCHNRACCNPAHLEPGTAKENTADMVRAQRNAKGERHYAAQLTRAEAARAYALYLAGGVSHAKLAEMFRVRRRVVTDILRGRTWEGEFRVPDELQAELTMRNWPRGSAPKLTEEQREEVRTLFETGQYSRTALGQMYGVHINTISRVLAEALAQAPSTGGKPNWVDVQ